MASCYKWCFSDCLKQLRRSLNKESGRSILSNDWFNSNGLISGFQRWMFTNQSLGFPVKSQCFDHNIYTESKVQIYTLPKHIPARCDAPRTIMCWSKTWLGLYFEVILNCVLSNFPSLSPFCFVFWFICFLFSHHPHGSLFSAFYLLLTFTSCVFALLFHFSFSH